MNSKLIELHLSSLKGEEGDVADWLATDHFQLIGFRLVDQLIDWRVATTKDPVASGTKTLPVGFQLKLKLSQR